MVGSLPDLTELSRIRAASRTVSDPRRHRNALTQVSANTDNRRDGTCRRNVRPPARATASNRQIESAASSASAASIRRLISRKPRKPKPFFQRFFVICLISGIFYTTLLTFEALAGAEDGVIQLAVMHSVAAVVAPFSPLILKKTGIRFVIAVANFFICILFMAHTVEIPLSIMFPLYALCGLTLSPLSLAMSTSATSLAQVSGDGAKRKVVLRQSLRKLRAAQDIGLFLGALMLGGAVFIWPEEDKPEMQIHMYTNGTNSTPTPPEPKKQVVDEDYEEKVCGAAGCPGVPFHLMETLSALGRKMLLGSWGLLALIAALISIYGGFGIPVPPPDKRSVVRDPRTLLGVPMGFFIGFQQGFIFTTFIKWYGVCMGGWSVAWRPLFGAGALQTVAAAILSEQLALGRRVPIAAGGALSQASLILAMFHWKAARNDLAISSVVASSWGACAALCDVLQSGLCVGGAGWRGPWAITLSARHAGLAVACIARKMVCVKTQLYMLAVSLVAATLSHGTLELRARRSQKQPA